MEINKRYLDIGLGVILLLLIVQFYFLFNSTNDCLANPFVYGAQKITNENSNILCSCNIIEPGVPYAPFTFDKKSIQVTPDRYEVRSNIIINNSLLE